MFNGQCSMVNVQWSMFNGHVLLSVGEKCSMFNVQCSMFNGQCSTVNVQRFNRFSAWRERSFPLEGQSFPTCGTGCSHWKDTYLSAGLFPTHKTYKNIIKITRNITKIAKNITKIAKTSPNITQNITNSYI